MVFAIVTWNLPEDVIIAMKGDGSDKPALFDEKEEAYEWGKENIAFNFRVIELH